MTTNETKPATCEVEVAAWCGNYKPWKARVYVVTNGERRLIGSTGFCKTRSAAQSAGERIAAQQATS